MESQRSPPPRVSSTQGEEGEEERVEEKYNREMEKSFGSSKSPSTSGTVGGSSNLVGSDDPSCDTSSHSEDSDCQAMVSSDQKSNEDASKRPRVCGVCGDKAKSMHFGGLSCDSCKAFFRRAVHKDAFLNFKCPFDGNCVLNVVSRKCCQFCRYKKCTSIGMDRSWVMSEEDRLQMMKQREERKSKQGEPEERKNMIKNAKREIQPYEPDLTTMLDHMTVKERDEIERAVLNYRRAYNEVPYRMDLKEFNIGRPSVQIINMFTTVVQRFAFFARLFPDFCNLPPSDQGCLLRSAILEMSLIRGVQTFDTENNRWPNTSQQLYKDAPTLRVEDMKKLVSGELYEMHIKFIHSMKELNVDEPVMMLLMLIVLFSSERAGLVAASEVQGYQEHYISLLRKYMEWRYGPHNTTILYPKLLLKLTDLRELNDQHTEYNLRLEKQEVAEIQTQLGRLNLNPYTEWPSIMHLNNFAGSDLSAQSSSQQIPQTSAGSSTTTNPVTQAFPSVANLSNMGINLANANSQATGSENPGIKNLANSLSSINFDNLANNPSFQRMIMQQFQKSIMNVLSSPNFGLGNLFPDGRNPQSYDTQHQQQELQQAQQQQKDQQHQQQHQQHQQPQLMIHQEQQRPVMSSHQMEYQMPANSFPQNRHDITNQQHLSTTNPAIVPSAPQPPPDLMAQISHLQSGQPTNEQNNQQFMGFGNQNQQMTQHYQHLQQQHRIQQEMLLRQQQHQNYHQQQQHMPPPPPPQQQHSQGTQLRNQQLMEEHMVVVPKMESVTPPPVFHPVQHLSSVNHPAVHHHPMSQNPMQCQQEEHLQRQVSPSTPPHQNSPQASQSSPDQLHQSSAQYEQHLGREHQVSHPKRNSLTDISSLSNFRTMMEEFVTLNDPSQLEQVKQMLGPDLVASLQQKFIASDIINSAQNPSTFQQQQQSQQPISPMQLPSSSSEVHMQHEASHSQYYEMRDNLQYFPNGQYTLQQSPDAGSSAGSSQYPPSASAQNPVSPPFENSQGVTAFCQKQRSTTSPKLVPDKVPSQSANHSFCAQTTNGAAFQYQGIRNDIPPSN